ncbi:MAG: hypothetical protein OEV21_02180 [Thermoplasmata archaeon]|nr:hypothetical protein [Thermoplasmata archaeon]
MLPIEFARISRGIFSTRERLTLVPYEGSRYVPVLWTKTPYNLLSDAIKALAGREGCKIEFIGYVRPDIGERNCNVIPDMYRPIVSWARSKKINAVIWADLPSNFYDRTGKLLTEYNIIEFVREMRQSGNIEAKEYVEKAPAQIKTRFREVIENEFGIAKAASINGQ